MLRFFVSVDRSLALVHVIIFRYDACIINCSEPQIFSGDCFSSETVGASIILACVANVSVGLRSKERPRNGDFQCFARANNVARAKKGKR